MDTLRNSSVAGLLLLALALSGCKLEIKVPQGGTVESTDGAYVCNELQTCVIEVTDIFFDQTFVAVPDDKAGFYFQRWEGEAAAACADIEDPVCHLSTAAAEDNPELFAFIESGQKLQLKPRFVWDPNCPPPELVISPAPHK